MGTALRTLGAILALAAGASATQNSNDSPYNNGGDIVFFYSDPSLGFTSGATTVDCNGDLYWRAHTGANFVNDVDATLAGSPLSFKEHAGAPAGNSTMEIDGYYESLFDTDFSTTPHFYARVHSDLTPSGLPALPGCSGAPVLSGSMVLIGPSGFGSPCTIAPSLCSPASMCAPPGFVNGWVADIGFSGAGIVITAAGTAGDSIATTWLVTGGMTATGGACGAGDYTLQDVHSTNETQADVTGTGINPSGGFQLGAGGLVNEGVTSMAEGHETWRNNIINVQARTLGGAVEIGDNCGGAMNGRNLSIGGGGSTIGVELRDFAGATAILGIVGASLTPLPNPGVPTLGGNLLVLPDGVFTATSALWKGPILPCITAFTGEFAFTSVQLPIPVTAAGATLHIQGARLDSSGSINTTNRVTTFLAP